MNGLTDTILQMMDTTPEPEDYMGEDGLLIFEKFLTWWIYGKAGRFVR